MNWREDHLRHVGCEVYGLHGGFGFRGLMVTLIENPYGDLCRDMMGPVPLQLLKWYGRWCLEMVPLRGQLLI